MRYKKISVYIFYKPKVHLEDISVFESREEDPVTKIHLTNKCFFKNAKHFFAHR